VRDRLDAAAGEIEVRDRAWVEDRERVEALRGEVHVAVVRERRGRDEEHALARDEFAKRVIDGVVELAHPRIVGRGDGMSQRLVSGRA
jgi:hypothetical protein